MRISLHRNAQKYDAIDANEDSNLSVWFLAKVSGELHFYCLDLSDNNSMGFSLLPFAAVCIISRCCDYTFHGDEYKWLSIASFTSQTAACFHLNPAFHTATQPSSRLAKSVSAGFFCIFCIFCISCISCISCRQVEQCVHPVMSRS